MEKKSNKITHKPLRVLLDPTDSVRKKIEAVKASNKCSTPKAIEWILEQYLGQGRIENKVVKSHPLTDSDVHEFLHGKK